jgi:hypothetical protein
MTTRDKTGSDTGLTSTQNAGDERELDIVETVQLYQPALGILVQVDWSKLPKMLAVAIAMQRMLEKEREQVHAMARNILKQAYVEKPEN